MKVLAAAFITALFFSALAVAVHYGTAQSSTDINDIPKPSIPEFSIAVINTSYNVPPTYSYDPTTGQMVINSSYYSGSVTALNVTLTIKNQPLAFSYYSWVSGEGFMYFIQVKPHNSTTWTDLSGYFGIKPSSSQSTIVTFQFSNPYFPVNGESGYQYPQYSTGLTYANSPFLVVTIPTDEQADFRVQTGIGDIVPLTYGPLFNGDLSDWNSITINITIGETYTSIPTSPSPTPTPSPPPTPYSRARLSEQEIIIGVAITAIVIGAGLCFLIYLIKRK